MKKLFTLASLLVLASLVLAACGGGAPSASDLLGAIKERGYILVSTDPNYAPQSFLSTEARATSTKCPADALTAVEMDGFDADVAKEIGKRLGVETCFATPDWDMVTAGSWSNKWDISVGSMTVKPPRPDTFFFTTPYYAPSGVVGVPADSTLTSVEELAGQSVCVATATTYFDWVNGTLDLNPDDIYAQAPADIKVVELPTDQECPQALDAGRKDFVAYVTSKTVVDANIAAGMAIKQLGDALFLEKNAVAFDKASSLDSASAVEAIDNIVKEMHGDGTLSGFSIKWFGTDLTQGLVK
ncbi:MAG: transporter substrate-binding domain-containing protein [Anaerolineales bacterium]|nr:transporter substrate-binding domain-containing protein [Anaerolineales bacterium]